MKIRKTLFLCFIPLFSFGQFIGAPKNEKIDEYYLDGKKIIKQFWKENEQNKTVMEITSSNQSEWRFFIKENNIEVGTNFSIVREYGKYIKVGISVVNKSENGVDFLPTNIDVIVNSDLIDKENYEPLLFNQYNKKVKKIVIHQARLAKKAKLDALVCSPQEVKIVKKIFKKEIITPGIRFNSIKNDQKRTMTPKQAYKNGSDWLVIGRPITKGDIKKNIKNLIDNLNQ